MKQLGLILILAVQSQFLFGWGQTGHRVIAAIAEENLSKKSKKALAEIMGCESLVEASTWMDNIKSDSNYDFMRSWHYVTIPEGKTYNTSEKSDKGDAYEAILKQKEVLQNPQSSPDEKRDAVRMLVHLVGDFHQPLHVGNGEDRGGNDVKVKWFYKKSNLHRIWDSEMIESKDFSYSELSELLICSEVEFPTSYRNTKLDLWVEEAVSLRPQIYDFSEAENLSYEYLYHNWETVRKQLLKGGLRLAAVLNEIFEN